jgi:hypothetical protein
VVTVEPETKTKEKTSNDENPDGSVSLLGDFTSLEGVVGSNPGTDSVGN